MNEHDAFLAAITASPGDDTARLVYADWLQEQSDAREAFVRAECALAAVPKEGYSQRLLLLAELLRLARGHDRTWAQRMSRVPIPPISCELILTPDTRPSSAYPKADVELTNITDEPVELTRAGSGQSLFHFLNLIHRDPNSELMPSGDYGGAYAMYTRRYTVFTLGPGERYRGGVVLMSNVNRPREHALPEDWDFPQGTYSAQALFEYGGWTAASLPVPYEFRPRKKYVPEWGAIGVKPRH